MKSQAIQRCWDEVRQVSKMASDLRYELERLEDDLLQIFINPGPFPTVKHDAKIAAKTVRKFQKQIKEIEQITDLWANENSPF